MEKKLAINRKRPNLCKNGAQGPEAEAGAGLRSID